MNKTTMYILIKANVPIGIAINSAAHASLACYLKFKDTEDMQEWLKNSFSKKTCVVTDNDFEKAKLELQNVIITESRLDGEEVAIAFCPRPKDSYPKSFNFFPLFPGKQ